jgi:hypothetical protein
MFGLKIVNSQNYSDLEWQLKNALEDGYVKAKKIDELQLVIKDLKAKIETLEKSKNVELLTDVAETPLTVEKKKRVVKKSGSTTTRKKVVHKSEE